MTLPSSHPDADDVDAINVPGKPTLVFQHGWAFDASFWAPLREALSEWPQCTLDRGYFDHDASDDSSPSVAPDDSAPHAAASGRDNRNNRSADALAPDSQAAQATLKALIGPVIWIGHSFGFMQGLAAIAADSKVDGLISINGFPRFSAAPDFAHGVLPRVLDRMASKLRTQTDAVVDDFRQRCGALPRLQTMPNQPLATPRLDPLLRDLIALRDDDHRATLRGYAGPMLTLASRADPIVPEAMMQAAFADRDIVWHSDEDVSRAAHAGHLLPSTAAAWCAQHIDAFLRRYWA